MKVLIFGGGGMLGHKLAQVLKNKFDLWVTFRSNLEIYQKFKIFDERTSIAHIDIEDINLVRSVLGKIQPDVIINAAGIIKQLPSTKSVIKTLSVNSIFPHRLAELAEEIQARLIIISTDCVFNGKKGKYTENDISDAEDLYGKSKNLGEVSEGDCLTIRTSIIGRELNTSHSLLEWFLSNEGKVVKGYTKAIFSGFPTIILAEIIADIIENYASLKGLYHVSSDPISKFDLLKLIKDAYGSRIEIEPFDDFEIDRSLDSTKFREATGFIPATWEKMINLMAADNFAYQTEQ